jgi:hypothetical protein
MGWFSHPLIKKKKSRLVLAIGGGSATPEGQTLQILFFPFCPWGGRTTPHRPRGVVQPPQGQTQCCHFFFCLGNGRTTPSSVMQFQTHGLKNKVVKTQGLKRCLTLNLKTQQHTADRETRKLGRRKNKYWQHAYAADRGKKINQHSVDPLQHGNTMSIKKSHYTRKNGAKFTFQQLSNFLQSLNLTLLPSPKKKKKNTWWFSGCENTERREN